MEKNYKNQDRNQRIYGIINAKVRYLFKEVLTSIEKESKSFDIKSEFFQKQKQKKPKGFYAIRKTLFDHGNEIMELLGIILDKVEVTPKNSVIQIDKKIIEEDKK